MQAVPVKGLLVKRKCSVSDMCPVCEVESESIEHALFLCPWTRCVGFVSRLSFKFDKDDKRDLGKWWVKELVEKRSLSDNQLAYFVWLMWLIWKERNRWVFEQKEPDPCRVINMANRAIDEYLGGKGLVYRKGGRYYEGH